MDEFYSGKNGHNHGIWPETRLAITYDDQTVSGSVGWTPSGQHVHKYEVSAHHHNVTIPSHAHEVSDHSHSIDIPDHVHTIPKHEHDIEYGIYAGPVAKVFDIYVDGKSIPFNVPQTDIDIIEFLSTGEGGKIQRNTWHEVQIRPGKLSRIVANLYLQIFTNSRGGGDY